VAFWAIFAPKIRSLRITTPASASVPPPELQPELQRPRLQRSRLGVGPYRFQNRRVRVPLSLEERARIEDLESAENERLAARQNGTSTGSVPIPILDA
jgi:hypothetical protein